MSSVVRCQLHLSVVSGPLSVVASRVSVACVKLVHVLVVRCPLSLRGFRWLAVKLGTLVGGPLSVIVASRDTVVRPECLGSLFGSMMQALDTREAYNGHDGPLTQLTPS